MGATPLQSLLSTRARAVTQRSSATQTSLLGDTHCPGPLSQGGCSKQISFLKKKETDGW